MVIVITVRSRLYVVYNYSGESCFEVKIEADSNDITEHPHDDKPSTGMLVFLIFILLCSQYVQNMYNCT